MNIMDMFGKAKELQAKMKEAQESVAQIIVTAESGAGLVKATLNGKKQILKLEIDKDIIKPEDAEMLQDLIAAAINKAIVEVEEKASKHIQEVAGNIMPNMPDFDLSKLGL